jgi:hypothetical protein
VRQRLQVHQDAGSIVRKHARHMITSKNSTMAMAKYAGCVIGMTAGRKREIPWDALL